MSSLSLVSVVRWPRRTRRALGVALALTLAAAASGATSAASAACPWIVQPYAESLPVTSAAPTVDIVFGGLDRKARVFYGFTVASNDLAWELTRGRDLPPLKDGARRLEAKATPSGITAYQVAPDTAQPQTIYLVAASSKVEALEQIDARIDPAHPVALSQLAPRTRGGSDWSGALPHRSLPGFEIASAADGGAVEDRAAPTGTALAGMQICAYELALR